MAPPEAPCRGGRRRNYRYCHDSAWTTCPHEICCIISAQFNDHSFVLAVWTVTWLVTSPPPLMCALVVHLPTSCHEDCPPGTLNNQADSTSAKSFLVLNLGNENQSQLSATDNVFSPLLLLFYETKFICLLVPCSHIDLFWPFFLPGFTDMVMVADFISCSTGLKMFANKNMVLHSHTLSKNWFFVPELYRVIVYENILLLVLVVDRLHQGQELKKINLKAWGRALF